MELNMLAAEEHRLLEGVQRRSVSGSPLLKSEPLMERRSKV